MKNYCKKHVGILFTILAIFAAAATSVTVTAQEKHDDTQSIDQSVNRMVGAWETMVQPRNCTTGDPIGQAFPGVITFNEGGTVAEFGANPAVPYRTPGHGIWSTDGGRGLFYMKFSFVALNPAGAPVGRMRVTQVGELPRFSDQSTSAGSFELTGLNGNVIATGCSTAVATRLN